VAVNVLLDTNAYVALLSKHRAVVDLVHASTGILFSPIVAGELLYGFRKGNRYRRNLRELEAFLEQPRVDLLPFTLRTSDRYGLIRNLLRREGKPIPSNDIWIAAHALEHGVDLVSFDAHFGWIGGLSWIDPTAQ
jgi:tRNA(fMet)-specific endonuclease VapC